MVPEEIPVNIVQILAKERFLSICKEVCCQFKQSTDNTKIPQFGSSENLTTDKQIHYTHRMVSDNWRSSD